MVGKLATAVGRVPLKNPLIAGSAEHFIEAEGVQRALKAGVGAVFVKSTNESEAARHQLQRSEYMVFGDGWRPVHWNAQAPASVVLACRSGLAPQSFESWLEQTAVLDRLAKSYETYALASIILAELKAAVDMARQVEQSGVRVLELNIGTPYASPAASGAVSTERDPERVSSIVAAVRAAVSIPLWVKITGQSERVPDLAAAAFGAGAEVVVMAGRLLGLIPNIDTFEPFLGRSLGVGRFWNLPLTCQWLALSRDRLGSDKPLIATNGAGSGPDIARMMLAGGSAVEMTSSVMLRGLEVLTQALAEFSQYLESKRLDAVQLIGRAADARRSFADMPMRTDNWRSYVP